MKIFKNILKGASFGITIGFLISLIVSSFYEGGIYYPSSLQFVSSFPREVDAIWYSIVIWATIGILFTYAGKIFKIEKWSLLKRSIIHFLLTILIFYFSGWVNLSLLNYIICLLIFCIIHIVIWIISFGIKGRELEMINNKLTDIKADYEDVEKLRKKRANQIRYSIRFAEDVDWNLIKNHEFVKANFDFINLVNNKNCRYAWVDKSYTADQISRELSIITSIPQDKITTTDINALDHFPRFWIF